MQLCGVRRFAIKLRAHAEHAMNVFHFLQSGCGKTTQVVEASGRLCKTPQSCEDYSRLPADKQPSAHMDRCGHRLRQSSTLSQPARAPEAALLATALSSSIQLVFDFLAVVTILVARTSSQMKGTAMYHGRLGSTVCLSLCCQDE